MTKGLEPITNLLPIVNKLVDKLKCSANITAFDNVYRVNIINKRKTVFFSNQNPNMLLNDLSYYYENC